MRTQGRRYLAVFCRGNFCSAKCPEAYNRDQANWLNLNAQRLDDQLIVREARIELRKIATAEKPLAKIHAMKPTHPSTYEARAVLWTGILGVAKQLGKREWLPIKRYPSVVQLREGTAETPVYFIGIGLSELHLAQLMCSEHSIFAVEVPWPSAWRSAAVKNDVKGLPTVEQLVAPYVAALSVHARSPCVLVGHSFSGLMAFEAAHQLNEQGGRVEMVILLDAQAKYPAPHHVAWQLLQKKRREAAHLRLTNGTSQSTASRLGGSWSIIRWMLVREMRGLGSRLLRDQGELTTRLDDLGIPWHWGLMMRVYSNALRSYRLRCIDCRGVLFRADEESPARTLDGSMGWGNLFRKGLEIIQVTGNHLTMMRQEPHDLTLARAMSKLLDRCAK
jgi:thioesterase domain-containing protein